MKVLAILGTTRKKGDSYYTIQEFEARLNRITAVEFEYLYLSEIELGFCIGCGACIRKGETRCPKRDRLAPIEQAMLEADGVIFAAPVYGHQVTALMKNFIDHFCYFFHRPRFFEKAALVLSTTGGSGLKDTLRYLRFTATGWGFHVIGSLGIISSAFRSEGCAYRAQKLREIDRMAARLVQLMQTQKRPAPSLFELLFFRGMRFKAKGNPIDRQYWEERDWLKRGYFVAGPIHPLKLVTANILEGIMGLAYRKRAKG